MITVHATRVIPESLVFKISSLQLRQHDPLLRLVFTFAVVVAYFADFVGLEEEDLTQAFVGVDAGREGRGVRDFEGDETFPLGLEWGHVDDDAAARVGALTDADRQYGAGNLEVLDGACQGKRVGRHDADIGLHGDKRALVKVFGVDDRRIYVGENFELDRK